MTQQRHTKRKHSKKRYSKRRGRRLLRQRIGGKTITEAQNKKIVEILTTLSAKHKQLTEHPPKDTRELRNLQIDYDNAKMNLLIFLHMNHLLDDNNPNQQKLTQQMSTETNMNDVEDLLQSIGFENPTSRIISPISMDNDYLNQF